MLSKKELEAALVERHGAEVQQKLSAAKVGIAGLGGLGSNIAIHMARLGVGTLVLVDFDCVELSNLNRQQYFIDNLGLPKAEILAAQLRYINPYLDYQTHQVRITPENAAELFSGCDVVCEAFDKPDQKAMLIETLLAETSDIPIVSGTGMAGYDSPNTITSKQRMSRLYVCGDDVSDVNDGLALMAPRVALCAAHESTVALRLLLGEMTV